MNPEPSNKKLYIRLSILIIVIIAIVYFVPAFFEQYRYSQMEAEAQEELDRAQQDTIKLAQAKVLRSEFESSYSADAWFEKFHANKIAFDQEYDGQILDVNGTITRISNDYSCSVIEIKAGAGIFDKLVFNNCNYGDDKWQKEVIEVAVGETVHIRGKYNGTESGDFEMDLNKCHIIKD